MSLFPFFLSLSLPIRDMTSNCRKYALISMCYIKFPTCRQPDLLNAKYFGQLARLIHKNFREKYFGQARNSHH